VQPFSCKGEGLPHERSSAANGVVNSPRCVVTLDGTGNGRLSSLCSSKRTRRNATRKADKRKPRPQSQRPVAPRRSGYGPPFLRDFILDNAVR
jgi:hypothetical protein